MSRFSPLNVSEAVLDSRPLCGRLFTTRLLTKWGLALLRSTTKTPGLYLL